MYKYISKLKFTIEKTLFLSRKEPFSENHRNDNNQGQVCFITLCQTLKASALMDSHAGQFAHNLPMPLEERKSTHRM